MINVFIGYDPREAIAYHVLASSILRRASGPVAITPLMLPQLEHTGVYSRKRDPKQSTDFTFSRFLTPYLADSRYSVFMDCDMLCLGDVYELIDHCQQDDYRDAWVVKHPDYTSCRKIKFLDQPQSNYPCKNWSSLIVFDNARMPVRHLTPDYINTASAMNLHQFKWATEVGELPPEWNHLVGEQDHILHPKLLHYTLGGPWFEEFEFCEYSDVWFAEYQQMCYCETRNAA